MENTTNIGTFSILDVETVEAADYSSAWYFRNIKKLKTRKYAEDTFSDKYSEVSHWIGVNRDRIRDLTLEEQEKMMIEESILSKSDI